MGRILEKFGFRRNKEISDAPESNQALEDYLKTALEQYIENQHSLINSGEAYKESSHWKDTRELGSIRTSLENLKKIIIETAQKSGKDGNELIAKADEEVQRLHERPKAA